MKNGGFPVRYVTLPEGHTIVYTIIKPSRFQRCFHDPILARSDMRQG